MNGDNRKGPLLPISGVAILLTALGVIIFTQAPFKGSRPYVAEIREPFEKVRARLWQDPFRAVFDYLQALGTSQPLKSADQCDLSSAGKTQEGGEGLSHQIEDHRKQGTVTVLGVMVFGEPYEEETEMRIRHRYAVLSGLRRLGFVPEDSGHLDFITLHDNNPAAGSLALSNILPFEWFKNNEHDSVLLLWLNDDGFQDRPLSRLANLAVCLRLKAKNTVKFKIIGPAGSTGLREMVKDAKKDEEKGSLSMLSGSEIYSATATVDDSLLLEGMGRNLQASAEEIEKEFWRHGITFRRTIRSDRELSEKLVEELRIRGVDPGKSSNHIALVAEWDTYYGRSLPETFERVLREEVKGEARVHRFSYLRGIDGRLPGEKEEKKDEKQEKESASPGDIKGLEQPTGKSQYDYLRRLAEDLYRFDQDLQVSNQGSIKAVGVLGSDFYDKFLVLQALRQRFPGIIFFTTDLDARLLHPDNIQWTRNLVVASSFGLALRRDIQGDVPPFRDNYQTSIFFATLRAFSEEKYSVLEEGETVKPPPRIYEVGRHRAFDLSPDDGSDKVHQAGPQSERSEKIFRKLAFTTILLLLLLFFTSVRAKNFMKNILLTGSRHPIITLIILLSLVIVIVYFDLGVLGRPDEEPFSIFEGVSIWPTEIFRTIAVIFSLYFLLTSLKRLRENCKEIVNEFGFSSSSGAREPMDAVENSKPRRDGIVGGTCKALKKVFNMIKYDWEVDGKEKGFTMDDLWTEYVRRDSWRYRIPRLIPIIVFYAVLCAFIIRFSGRPMIPARGTVSIFFDRVILLVSVFSFVYLVFYVFDVTRLCYRFINIAAKAHPTWSQGSLMQFTPNVGEMDETPTGERMLVHLIARRSDVVGKLIFYPFIVWFIMFMSRISYFDNWQTPIGLGVVISMSAVYAWSCAFVLRRSAESARTIVVRRLTNHLFGVLSNEKPNQDRVKRIEFVLNEVKSTQEGAFAPFTQHPVMQALVVPFGGVGGLYLIDFFTKLNI